MIIAKQMDIRANIKEFFDMAYNGETILVPRKQNRNVIIISEEEYKKLNQASRMKAYSVLLSKESSELKTHNLQKITVIRSFRKNWNGNGAPALPKKLLDKTERLINELIIQPEIFPTALGTIQFEYDNSRRDHMEIEIDTSDVAEIYIVKFNGEECTDNIEVTAEIINERVRSFYE